MNLLFHLTLAVALWAQRSSSFTNTLSDPRHDLNNNIFGGETCRTRLNGSENGMETTTPDMGDVGFVLLAGGKGSRMKSSMRKF